MSEKSVFLNENGAAVYHAKPCKKSIGDNKPCGCITRYASNRNCVACKQRANANAEAVKHRTAQRKWSHAGLSVRDSLTNYFRQGGQAAGAPQNSFEAYGLFMALKHQSGVVRVLEAYHKERFQLDHLYPINPSADDPNAIYTQDGVLMVGRHVASNLQLIPASVNNRKNNRIEAGSYSANQLCPLVVAEYTHNGKRKTGAQLFKEYQESVGFHLFGVRKKIECKKALMENKPDYEYQREEPIFKTSLPFKRDWVAITGEVFSGYQQHERYGDLTKEQGLRYYLANEVRERIENALECDKDAVLNSGDYDAALAWLEYSISPLIIGMDIEPCYLPVVDTITNKQFWEGGKVGNDGILYRYATDQNRNITDDETPEPEVMKDNQSYYEQFKKPLPKYQWEAMWTGLIKANSVWTKIRNIEQDETEGNTVEHNGGAIADMFPIGEYHILTIYEWLGQDLEYGNIDQMKADIWEKMSGGPDAELFAELVDKEKDWRALTGTAAKHCPNWMGYPRTKGIAMWAGMLAADLDEIKGNQTLPAQNRRQQVIALLNELSGQCVPFLAGVWSSGDGNQRVNLF